MIIDVAEQIFCAKFQLGFILPIGVHFDMLGGSVLKDCNI
jgi:hypothetical protein